MSVVYRNGNPEWQEAADRAEWRLRLMRESDYHDRDRRALWLDRLKRESDCLTLVHIGRGKRVHVVLGPWEAQNDVLTVCGLASRNADWHLARYDDCPSPCCLNVEWPGEAA